MSETEVRKIVFLVSPDLGQDQLRDIKFAILKYLCYFCESSPPKSKVSSQTKILSSDKVRWNYRFLGSTAKNYPAVQDWKDVGYTEFCVFEEELEKQLAHQTQILNGAGEIRQPGGAFLADALKAVVYDYGWDNYGLISPVKRPTRRSSNSSRLAGWVKKCQNIQNSPANMVVVVSPLPKTQSAIDLFFNWDDTDLPYVSKKLMPVHLKSYFKGKYSISPFWIDTSDLFDCKDSKSDDLNGMTIIRQFLWSLGGDIMPVVFFSNSKHGGTTDSVAVNELGMSMLFLSTKSSVTTNVNDMHNIHVAKTIRAPDNSVNVQKLFTLTFNDLDTVHSAVRSLMKHPCSTCRGSGAADKRNLVHEVQQDKNKTIQITLKKISSDFKGENTSKSSSENILVILGQFSKAQIPEILDYCGLKQFFSVWCKINWSSVYDGFECNVVGRSYVAEVYKFCTSCKSEVTIEEHGLKYAVIEIKGRNIAMVTYFRLKPSILLDSHSCKLSTNNQYSITSPVKNSFPSKLLEPMSACAEGLARFSPSMLESWWLVNPLTDPVFETIKAPKTRKPNLTHKKLLEDLQKLYETKNEPNRDQIIQDASDDIALEPTSTSSSNPFLESDPPKVDEMFTNAVEAMIEGEMTLTQVDIAIHATNSLFAMITFTTSEPSIDEYTQKLREMEYYYNITDVKKFTDKRKQITLSIIQIFILLKLAQLFPHQEIVDNIIEDVCAHLRSISLTASHAMMKSFLEVALVERYSGSCGKLLYEVHNELMLPIPESLQKYSKEDEDTTFSDSVLLSCGSFTSLSSSNVGSSKSCRGADTKPSASHEVKQTSVEKILMRIRKLHDIETSVARRRAKRAHTGHQRFSSASSSRLRRIIKIPNQLKDQCNKAIDRDKRTVDDKKEKMITRDKSESSTKSKARSIKRDLFSVQDKQTEKKPVFGSPESKKRCDISVTDTPHVKQRMTALTRQRLRLHKQKAMEKEIGTTKVIEESPAKIEDESCVKLNQRMKLTRKHSFYCEGMDSRNVTRAKSLQQHNQAVLATPLINNATKGLSKTDGGSSRKYTSNLGRRSLHCLLNLPVKSPTSLTSDENCNENRGITSPTSRISSVPHQDITDGISSDGFKDVESAIREDDRAVWNTPKSKRPLFVVESPDQQDNSEVEKCKNELWSNDDEDLEPFSADISDDSNHQSDVKPFPRRSRRKRKLFSSISE